MTLFRVRVLYKQYISPEVRYLLLKALFKTSFGYQNGIEIQKINQKKNRKKTNVEHTRWVYTLFSRCEYVRCGTTGYGSWLKTLCWKLCSTSTYLEKIIGDLKRQKVNGRILPPHYKPEIINITDTFRLLLTLLVIQNSRQTSHTRLARRPSNVFDWWSKSPFFGCRYLFW